MSMTFVHKFTFGGRHGSSEMHTSINSVFKVCIWWQCRFMGVGSTRESESAANWNNDDAVSSVTVHDTAGASVPQQAAQTQLHPILNVSKPRVSTREYRLFHTCFAAVRARVHQHAVPVQSFRDRSCHRWVLRHFQIVNQCRQYLKLEYALLPASAARNCLLQRSCSWRWRLP